MSTKRRFRIAFSFAGERRDFVSNVAEILARRFGQEVILYDKFHEAEFARHDVGAYLPKLYSEQSDLIVPVLCPHYDPKRWTGWEWLHIYGLLTKIEGHRVMPSRFEHANADGLSPAAGFVELDKKTPDQFVTLILERMAINDGKPREYFKSTDVDSKPHVPINIPDNNLPRSQLFFGRESELEKVADALTPQSRGWGVLIDGPGGIGKTSLAIRAAELVPPERFRRIIFLSSKEHELTADGKRALGDFVIPTYLEMLNAIAREIEQPNLADCSAAERTDKVLRALRDADFLLVLDNLETLPEPDRDQIFLFLNRLPRGCSAIVTSRRRADAQAAIIRLDKLDWPACRELLAELARNNDRLARTGEGDRRDLYYETGGNPQLIRWVVGQLGLGRCRTIADALAFLRSAPPGNDPLEFVFGELLANFSENEIKILAALTHFTMPAAVRFIGELAGVNEFAAQGALSDLFSRSLVLPDLEERHFALVPMVCDFLRRREPGLVGQSSDRLEKRVYALVVENGYEKHERFPVLEREWPTIAAAFPKFLTGPNHQFQTVCDALYDFLKYTGRWDELLGLWHRGESRAVEAKDMTTANKRAHQAGLIYYYHRHQWDEVINCATRAEGYGRGNDIGPYERADALRLRALGLNAKGDYIAAISDGIAAVNICRPLGHENGRLANALKDLAASELQFGDLEDAETHFQEALKIFMETADFHNVAICTSNLAAVALAAAVRAGGSKEASKDVTLAREYWDKTEKFSREALSLSEKLQMKELIAFDCYRIARALVEQGRLHEGQHYAKRAVDILTSLKSPFLINAQRVKLDCDRDSSVPTSG